jgi:hypothetical protein
MAQNIRDILAGGAYSLVELGESSSVHRELQIEDLFAFGVQPLGRCEIPGHIDAYIKSGQDTTSLSVVIRQEVPPDQTSILTRAQRPNQPIMALGDREHTTKRVLRPR